MYCKQRMETQEIKTQLRERGLRATPARIEVLELLQTKKQPIGIEVVEKEITTVNKVTLYRMMTDFVKKGLVEEVNLGHGHMDYELANRPHHHHLVCDDCGTVEDIYPCETGVCELESQALKASTKFSHIKSKQQTFFGTCNNCAT